MDPKRRLQVLSSANPSIRLAAAPAQQQQQLSVSTAQPSRTISIATPKGVQTVKPTTGAPISAGQPAAPKPNGLIDMFGKSTAKLANSSIEGVRDTVELTRAAAAALTHNQSAEQAAIDRGLSNYSSDAGTGIGGEGGIFSNKEVNSTINPGTFTKRVVGTGAGAAGELAPFGAGKITEAASAGRGVLTKLAVTPGMSTLGTALREGAVAGGIGTIGSAGEQLSDSGKISLKKTLLDGGVSALAGGVIGGLSHKLLPSAAQVGLTKHELGFIQKSKDPEQIHTLLSSLAGGSSDALQQLSVELASTKSKREIIKAIEDLPFEAGATGIASSLASNAVAKGKYGEGPLTGESAPHVAPVEPEKVVPLGPQDPNAPPTDGSIPLTGTAMDEPLPQEMIDHAMQTAGVAPEPTTPPNFSERLAQKQADAAAPTPEDKIRMSPINENAKDVMVHPQHSDAIVHGILNTDPNATSVDALNTVVNALAHSPNKGDVRNMINGLFHDKATGASVLEGNDLNRIVKDVTKSTDPEEIKQHLAAALDNHDAKAATPTTEQLANATPNEGAVAPEVKADGSTVQTEAPAPDQKVAEQVNANADTPVNDKLTTKHQLNDAPVKREMNAKDLQARIDELNSIPVDKRTVAQQNEITRAKAGLKRIDEASKPDKFFEQNPNLDDTERSAISKVWNSLDPAQKAYDTAQKARKTETAIRFGNADKNFEAAGGGQAGFKAKFNALAGKKTASEWAGADLTPEEGDALHNLVQKTDGLQSGQKFNTQKAIDKVWGANPQKPAAHDINYIRTWMNNSFGEGIGDSFAGAMQEAAKSKMSWQDAVSAVAGLPKSLMATFDFSAPRQAGALAVRHPGMFVQEYAKSFKAAFNPDYYEKYMKEMADDKDWSVISDNMGVNLPGITGGAEERYANTQIAEKIPLYGKSVVKGSERAYNSLLTGLRFRAAKAPVDAAGGGEKYISAMEGMYGDKASKAMETYGEMINTLSGRGGAKGGILEEHMTTASRMLFSPRLWAANVQRLNPVWYGKLAKDNPAAAKEAVASQAAFMAMVGTTLYLANQAPGVTVGTDMRSADFGKIKIGNTRMDIMGGQQQNIVQAWRQITGEKVNSETGEVSKLGDKYGSKNRFDLFVDMLISKSNPLINTAIQVAKSHDDPNSTNPLKLTDQYGDSYNVAGKVGALAAPLNLTGVVDTYKDTGSVAKSVAFNAPGFFGAGVNTYGSVPTKDKGQVIDGKTVSFKGKITNDMVTDANGNAMLDAKGKPVKVTIPAGADATTIKALKDDKRIATEKANFKSKLSTRAQALIGKSDGELQKYVKDGTIKQADMDYIKQQQSKLSAIDKSDDANPSNIPEGLDGAAANFYEKYNSLDKDQKAEFTKHGATTPESQALVDELNNNPNNPEDVPKLSKGNNQLAKLYADYKANLIKNKDTDTVVDQQNKAKAFWTAAIKTQHDSVAQDLYSEGNSKDFKALVKEGKLKQSQVDAAIALDDALYKTGFVGLKFSKKFRDEWGYGTPSKTTSGKHSTGSSSGSGGSSKGSTASINAHLDSLLIPTSTGQSGKGMPTFSQRKRNIQFKASGAVPQGSSGKKVSIRL